MTRECQPSAGTENGDIWRVNFTGKRVKILAPTGDRNGKMRVLIDGRDCGIVQFSYGPTNSRQIVFESRKLKGRRHSIELINLEGSIAIDALVI